MNIKDKIQTLEHVVTYKVAEYTKEDIIKLISEDLTKHGYVVNKTEFKLDYKYATDEWGMNSSMRLEFRGVVVELKEEF